MTEHWKDAVGVVHHVDDIYQNKHGEIVGYIQCLRGEEDGCLPDGGAETVLDPVTCLGCIAAMSGASSLGVL